MKNFLKENWKFLLFVLIGGLIGGYCIGLHSYDSLSLEILNQLQEQNVTKEMVALSTMFQYSIPFGLILASIGIVFSKKINLWREEFKFDKKAFIVTAIIAIVSSLTLFPGDKLIFGSFNNWVNEQYMAKPTIQKIIGGLLVGGIIEEVMMRLFCMTLLIYFISKIFYNKKEIPTKVYVIANIISALLFAVGHIPSTMNMTTLTTVLIIRCMLLNGGFGLCFGYLYRKYGIGYAMISHGFAHLISDILMLIFI